MSGATMTCPPSNIYCLAVFCWMMFFYNMHALKHIEKSFINNLEIHLFLMYGRERAMDPKDINVTSVHFNAFRDIMPLEVTFVHFDV